MRLFVFLLAFLPCFLTSVHLKAQSGWQATQAPMVQRYDDIFFLNADTGWAIAPWDGFSNQPAKILRTTDGGTTWDTQVDSAGMTYRSIGFFDHLDGFIGVLEEGQSATDTAIMLHTTDGGQNWLPVTNLPGPRPAGGCGIFIAGDSTLYAVGRYFGPSHVYKTTDRGQSWSFWSLDSLAGGLVDAHFWTPDSGIVVGSSGLPWADSSGVILRTWDGGQTWSRLYRSQDASRMCWKISFPSRNIGYVSLQQFGGSGPAKFIKTTDGGATWQEYIYRSSYYNGQGIGFLNDTVGWIGGNYSGFLNYVTTDGGATWTNEVWGGRVNRIRVIHDSLVYASGREVYRWDGFPPTSVTDPGGPAGWNVSPAYPNPADETVWLEVEMPAPEHLRVRLYDAGGRLIEQGQDAEFPSGRHPIAILTGQLPTGIYLVRVEMGEVVRTRKFAVKR